MTIGEFLEKGEGKIWVVKKNNPVNVSEIDGIAMSKKTAVERHYFYFGWYEERQNFQYVLARKSKDKKRTRRDGFPSVVCINNAMAYVAFDANDLDKTKLEKYGYFIFFNKEDACDYVIEKIKQKKLQLNSYILKVNKMKFSIA